MKMNDLETKKTELMEKTRELDDAVQRFQEVLSSAKQELEAINRTFPSLLAREFMGYSKTEAYKAKKRRKQLITFIEESVLIQAGFEDERKRLNRDALLIGCLKRDLARYESLKQQLSQNPRRTDLENQFLGLGHELGCLPDAQTFLHELKGA